MKTHYTEAVSYMNTGESTELFSDDIQIVRFGKLNKSFNIEFSLIKDSGFNTIEILIKDVTDNIITKVQYQWFNTYLENLNYPDSVKDSIYVLLNRAFYKALMDDKSIFNTVQTVTDKILSNVKK